MLPFCITGKKLKPIYHLGAVIGDEGAVLGPARRVRRHQSPGGQAGGGPLARARALGPHWVVLMRRHGATVAGTTLRDCVFRTIYSCRNAEYQLQAEGLGAIGPLSAGEAEQAGEIHQQPGPLNRAWEYWVRRVEKKGEAPPRATAEAQRRGAQGRRVAAPQAAAAGAKKKAARKGRR